MKADLDLSQLALKRPDRPSEKLAGRRSFLKRYVVSGAILVGFVMLLIWGAREQILPRKAVSAVPVIVTRSEVHQEGTALFQAAGWIEPRPTPVIVTALTEGVVEQLLVVEGQIVEAGEAVARLIDTDAKLAAREAEATLALRYAELQSAEAELRAAELRVKHPVHLDAAIAEADSLSAKAETELAKTPFLIISATARLEMARRTFEGKRTAGAAIAERLLHQAETDHLTAEAELAELKQRGPRLEREVETLQRKRTALTRQRELLIDESRQLADTQAKVQATLARQEQARLAVDKSKLALERTIIRAAVGGKVLQLVARPGTRVTATEGAGQQSSATIATLYDPAMLQVRADVRLEDVGQIQPNQPVRIETASAKEPLKGFVLQATSSANIQKNTLEVKVAIENPPPHIRPEMLVAATFLAPAQLQSDHGDKEAQDRLLIPKQLVIAGSGGQSVWIVDHASRAELRSIRLGSAGREGLVEVVEGLTATDKLISSSDEGLQPGDRVIVTGGASGSSAES